MANVEELKNRLDQAKIDKQSIEKNIEELQKEIEASNVEDIYMGQVTVGISGRYILVYGRDVQDKNSKVKGYPITVDEAEDMIDALETMIDRVEE